MPFYSRKIKGCDIFIIGTPVRVGRLASTAQRIIERSDAIFHEESLQMKRMGNISPITKLQVVW